MSKHNNLVKKIEVFEKLALYGSRSSFLSKLAQEASMPEPNFTPNPNAAFGPPTPPEFQKKPALPTIPTSVQKSLNFLSSQAGTPLNLKEDGVLGPKTRAGLNWFATANHLVGKSDKDLFAAIAEKQKEEVQKATKQPNIPGPVVPTEPVEMSNIKAPMSRV